jgi:fructose-1-phosphate kinase PfkB-like protein
MDVSNKAGQESTEALTGYALTDTVASLTGLPEGLVQQELHELLETAGQDNGSVTLDQLRQAMLLYLEALAQQEESLMDPEDAALRASESSTIPSV